MRKKIFFAVIITITICAILILFLRLASTEHIFSLRFVQQQRFFIATWTRQHYILAIFTYISCYFFAASLALPAVSLLTITGGFLFGPIEATLYTVIGATSGAIVAFIASRYLFGSLIQQYYQQQLHTLYTHLMRYGAFYLIWARLIPIFPFFVVNILAGLMPITLVTFIITTAFGIIPVTFLYAFAGQQLMSINSIRDIFSVYTMIIFSLLALLAMLPFVLKRISRS